MTYALEILEGAEMKIVLTWVIDQTMALAVIAGVAIWLAMGGDFGGDE